jgi:hypothetical protein
MRSKFPNDSVRQRVATLGDDWAEDLGDGLFQHVRLSEFWDQAVIRRCASYTRRHGRERSAPIRAGFGHG